MAAQVEFPASLFGRRVGGLASPMLSRSTVEPVAMSALRGKQTMRPPTESQGHVQTEHIQVAQAYDEVAAGYDSAFRNPLDLAEDYFVKQQLKAMGTDAPGCRVLDVGCGTGHLLSLLPKRAQDYVGIDISEGMLGQAKIKFSNYEFLHLDVCRIGFHEEFDTVVSLYAPLNYVVDLEEALASLHRALRPGGRVFIILYAKGYETMHNKILGGRCASTPASFHSAARLKNLLSALFTNVELTGLTYRGVQGRLFPNSPWIQRVLTRVLAGSYGNVAPDRASFILCTARK